MSRVFPMPNPARQFPMPNSARSAPLNFHVPSRSGQKSSLLEIYLDSGVRRMSFQGVAASNGFYEPRLIRVPTIRRELGILANTYRGSDISITVANPNREWETILANEVVIGRSVKYRFANLSEAIEDAGVLFSGVIADVELHDDMTAVLNCRDTTFDFLDQPLSSRLLVMDAETFPTMPLEGQFYIGKLVPVVYGAWSAAQSIFTEGNCALPAYLIEVSGSIYRYAICQLADGQEFVGETPLSGTNTRRYGDSTGAWLGGSTPFLEMRTYSGVRVIVINNQFDQRDSARRNEPEITIQVDGITLDAVDLGFDFAYSGTPITNPASQLYDFLTRFGPEGLSTTDFDRGSSMTATSRDCGNSSWLEAETASDATDKSGSTPHNSLVWIGGDPQTTYRDVVRMFSESYPMGIYVNRAGKYGCYLWTHAGSRDSSIGSTSLKGYVDITDETDISEDTYHSDSMSKSYQAASSVLVTGETHIVDRKPFDQVIVARAAYLTYLAGKIKQPVWKGNYLYQNNDDVGDAVLDLLSPLNRIHEFKVPIDWFWEMELARLINIQHRRIIGSYFSEVMKDAPSGFWRVNEEYGTSAFDSSGNGLTGTYQNTPALGVAGLVTSDTNKAVLLNGTDEYITVPDNSLLDPGDTFTLEAWVGRMAQSGAGSAQVIFSKGTNGYLLTLDVTVDGAQVILFKQAVGGAIASSSNRIPLGLTGHIAVVKNGATTTIYVNGLDVTVAGTDQTIISTATDLNIGRHSTGIRYFVGILDELAIYPTALSSSRIMAHYQMGFARYSPIAVARILGLELNPDPDALDIQVRALEVRTAL